MMIKIIIKLLVASQSDSVIANSEIVLAVTVNRSPKLQIDFTSASISWTRWLCIFIISSRNRKLYML